MLYIIAKDDLNRDYHNDKLIAVYDPTVTYNYELNCQRHCHDLNKENDGLFYTIICDLSVMNLDSMYDLSCGITTFEQFLVYTGFGIIPHDQAYTIYKSRFN